MSNIGDIVNATDLPVDATARVVSWYGHWTGHVFRKRQDECIVDTQSEDVQCWTPQMYKNWDKGLDDTGSVRILATKSELKILSLPIKVGDIVKASDMPVGSKGEILHWFRITVHEGKTLMRISDDEIKIDDARGIKWDVEWLRRRDAESQNPSQIRITQLPNETVLVPAKQSPQETKQQFSDEGMPCRYA